MINIADSAVFMLGMDVDPSTLITVASVVDELRTRETMMRFEVALEGGARVEPIDPAIRKQVIAAARTTKDLEVLSSTDIDVLAKALEYGKDAVILTDDYAIQNTASILGIRFMPVVQKKIRDVLEWDKQCFGCHRRFPEGDICPVCGSELRKRRKRKI